ncbi:MAG: helix-turn-helix domain-containing protein [Bacilli bacterium]
MSLLKMQESRLIRKEIVSMARHATVILWTPDRKRIRGTPVGGHHCRLRSHLRPKLQAVIIPLQRRRKRRPRSKEKWRERLRFLRTSRKMTFEQVAKATGKTLRCVRGWERGYAVLRVDGIAALADFYGVSCDYLGGYSGDPRRASDILRDIHQSAKRQYPQWFQDYRAKQLEEVEDTGSPTETTSATSIFAIRLRQLRNSRKLSVAKAAKRMGVSPFALRSWEASTIEVHLGDLEPVTGFYGVTHDFLVGRARW